MAGDVLDIPNGPDWLTDHLGATGIELGIVGALAHEEAVITILLLGKAVRPASSSLPRVSHSARRWNMQMQVSRSYSIRLSGGRAVPAWVERATESVTRKPNGHKFLTVTRRIRRARDDGDDSGGSGDTK